MKTINKNYDKKGEQNMFIIPESDIRNKMRKSGWRTDVNRIKKIINAYEKDPESIPKSDVEFAEKHINNMLTVLDIMNAEEISIADYYIIRDIMMHNNISPEAFDNYVYNHLYDAMTIDISPDEFKNIDETSINHCGYIPSITKIVSNEPDTVVYFNDDTHTVVHCENDEEFDIEKGIYLAILKKTLGPKNLQNLFRLIAIAKEQPPRKSNNSDGELLKEKYKHNYSEPKNNRYDHIKARENCVRSHIDNNAINHQMPTL